MLTDIEYSQVDLQRIIERMNIIIFRHNDVTNLLLFMMNAMGKSRSYTLKTFFDILTPLQIVL